MPQLTDVRDTLRTAASSDVLVFPTDAGWDDARRAWNLAVDQRPAVVALPRSVDDVVDAVDYARTLGLRIAVQGTGHGAPRTPLDGTMLVNTSRMTGVEVDPKGRTARVAAGTIWADVVDAAVPHGLTALHGSAHDVGVVGYSLGGGIGWLARKHGLSSSSVLSAQVVTAEGEVLRADRETNADLFWALRGGGGSFGIVTEVEIALFPVAEAYAGWLVWPMERAPEVLGAWAEWTKDAPEEVTSLGRMLQIPPIPEMPEPLRGRQVVVVEAAFLGTEEEGRELLRPLRDLEPELDTFATVPAAALTQLRGRLPLPGRRLRAADRDPGRAGSGRRLPRQARDRLKTGRAGEPCGFPALSLIARSRPRPRPRPAAGTGPCARRAARPEPPRSGRRCPHGRPAASPRSPDARDRAAS